MGDFRAAIDTTYGDEVQKLVGTCEGIQRFCDVIGIAPSKLLVLAPGSMSMWEFGTRLRESHPPDETVAQVVKQNLLAYWAAMTLSEQEP